MRHDLKVPFADKEAAKKLGARWDPARKIWYVADLVDVGPFLKWSPIPHDVSNSAPSSVAQKSGSEMIRATGKVYVGSNYVERPRVCECLPWDVCDTCRATALNASF